MTDEEFKKHANHASPAIIMYHYSIVRNKRAQGFPRFAVCSTMYKRARE